MKAIVVEIPGSPEVLQIKEIPRPEVKPGWVLIKVKAFGLNRSEMFTRQGHSPSVKFPRVLGIECAGIVEQSLDANFIPGQTVAAVMGGMGRQFDGSYAEYTLVPTTCLIPLKTDLDWSLLAAIPETYLTAWYSLVEGLEVEKGQSLLIRGGTSSVGMAAIKLASYMGLKVVATTRNQDKSTFLQKNGADFVLIDDNNIAPAVRELFPNGVNRVLELIGTKTLLDSLQSASPKGIVCMTGILGNEWAIKNFEPMTAIPSTVKLTMYSTETLDCSNAPLQQIVDAFTAGKYKIDYHRAFKFDEIVAAHYYMEENHATGKLVVTVE